MKIAVYTFISGGYDTIKSFDKKFTREADFYLFTDKVPEETKGYKIIEVPIVPGNERYTSRYYKILSHVLFPAYDYTIWIDGSTSLTVSPRELIEKYLDSFEVAAFKYPDEDCVYIHAEKCMTAGRLGSYVALQMDYYRSVGFPEHAGLCEMRVLLRRNTEDVTTLNNLWLETYNRWLTCDQLCFNYCLWRLNMRYNTITWGSPEFLTGIHAQYSPHKYIYQL